MPTIIEEALAAVINADAGVVATGAKVFADYAPQDTKAPYVLVAFVNTEDDLLSFDDNDPSTTIRRYQISAVTTTMKAAELIIIAVRAAILGSGKDTTGQILSALPIAGSDSRMYRDELSLWFRTQDFLVFAERTL